ncbi:mucin-5AC-like [Acanthaster planci]|uniref:Ashwin n=1 Tax=Acanthaster planci TaxID=133434 RepID=A0A8B7ZP71_ACAPL|nr:mucin-5AC-like [Acanthaster planci]
MEQDDEPEAVVVDILHPEILSREDLADLLSQRHIKLDRPNATKEDLLEIFHRTITPLPQRAPRANRRGRTTAQVHRKLLQAKRRLQANSDQGSKVTMTVGFSKSQRNQQSPGLNSSSSSSSSPGTSRLKPPPVVTSKQRTLKLPSSKTSSWPSGSSSTTIKAAKDSTSPATNSQVDLEPKKIVTNKSTVQSKRDSRVTSPTTSAVTPDSLPQIKLKTSISPAVAPVSDKMRKMSVKPLGSDSTKIALKRPVPLDINGKTNPRSSDTTTKTSSSEDDHSPKQKIKRISWP